MTKAAELAKMGEVLTNSQIGGRRNLIINGSQIVAQRGSDINDVANGGFCTDRFKISKANTDNLVLNLDQSTDTPTGFSNSLKLSVGTVESALASDEYLQFGQRIEAQNLQHLNYGTSSAETLTLSFHVKSSITGTYAVSLFQSDATKYYSATYTISSANTWEFKTLKINGNTADVINNDNGEGLRVNWTLSAGSDYTSGSNDAWGAITNWSVGHNVSWITTSGATFFLTGVQLEVGSQATPFEHRSFGEELRLCKRYFHQIGTGEANYTPIAVGNNEESFSNLVIFYPVKMRAVPTLTYDGLQVFDASVNTGITSTRSMYGGTQTANLQLFHANLTRGRGVYCSLTGTSSYMRLDAEL
tara:strand:- start:118 stop:1194 length:1077 start_codon:yes stop_codon:yes gene_type:complete